MGSPMPGLGLCSGSCSMLQSWHPVQFTCGPARFGDSWPPAVKRAVLRSFEAYCED
ncbi:unnamed protein product [Ixodes pacificus]